MKERILIVDDEPVVLDTLKALLTKKGYVVHQASTGEEALALVRSDEFDLIITDVKMPQMDGLELMKQIKDLDHDIEIILLTGFNTIDYAIQALRGGAFDYLTKPLSDMDRLFSSISHALEKRRLKIENQELIRKLQQANEDLESRVQVRTEELNIELAERKRAEEELRKAKEDAETASRAKSDFLHIVSHELRTPMNAIIGFTDIMLRKMVGSLNQNQEQYLNYVLQSARSLMLLINDILDLSRAMSNRLELRVAEIDLKRLIQESVNLFDDKIDKNDIQISIHVGEIPVYFLADALKLRQIFHHLISNAIKFNVKGGKIDIITRYVNRNEQKDNGIASDDLSESYKHEDFIECTVSDTGIGIEHQNLKCIFNPFMQVDCSTTRKFEGTGLGLALTKKLVELHGGTIWAKSNGIGKGSTFRFIIPIHKPFCNTIHVSSA